jgi:hypothetical protein
MTSSLKSAEGSAALISAQPVYGKRSGEMSPIVPAGNPTLPTYFQNDNNFTEMNPL